MIISIINQKGGVAKTTTTFNLAAHLADAGYKVLQIDMDPQASLTIINDFEPTDFNETIYNVLVDHLDIGNVIYNVDENLDICISNLDLSAAEVYLVNAMARETVLKRSLKEIRNLYDFILIDCPPNLGILTINALCASDKIIIPVSTDYLALRGLNLLLDTVEQVKTNLNDELEILGLVATMYDTRTRHSNEILKMFEDNYHVLGIISHSVKVKDSNLASDPLIHFAPTHKTSLEYKEVAIKIIEYYENEKKDRKD